MNYKTTFKQFWLLSIAIFFTWNSYAQSPFKVGISMGTIVPLGELKSTNFGSGSAGFSQNGFNLNFEGDYFLNNRVALCGRIYFGTTSINKPAYMDKLDSDVKDYLMETLETTRYDIGYWMWAAPMVGIKVNYPISLNKAWVEAGIYSGINISQIPDQSMQIADSIKHHIVVTENITNTDISLPLLFDVGLRFKINDQAQLSLKAAYFQTNTQYAHRSYLVEENNASVLIPIKQVEQKIPVQNLNFTIGIIYNID